MIYILFFYFLGVLYESSEDEQHTSRNAKKALGRVSSDSADEIFDRTPKELVKHKTMGSATKGAPATTPRASVKFQSFNVIYSPGRITSGPGSGPRPSMAIVTTPLKKRDAENVVPVSSRRQLKELTTTRTPAQNVTPKTTTPVVAQPQPTEDPKERPNVDRRRSAKPATIIPKETEEVDDVPKSSTRREPQADLKERFITERRRPLKNAANNVITQEAVETPLNPARREPPADRSNAERRRSARAATDDVIPQEIEQANLPTPSSRQESRVDPKERPNTDRRRPAKVATNNHQGTEEIVDQPATSAHIELNEETKERSKADRRRPAKITTNVVVHQQTEEVVDQAHREFHEEPKERPKADRQRPAKTETNTFTHQETEEVLNQPENSARQDPREDLKERLNGDRRRPAKGSTNMVITQEEIAVDQSSAARQGAGALHETGTLPKKTKTGTVDLPRQSTPQQTRTPFKEANNVVHPQRTPLRSTSTPTVHPATPLSSHTTEPIGNSIVDLLTYFIKY